MSYIPIDFENLPSKNTPVSAENLNYVQQGVVLAVDRSREAKQASDVVKSAYDSGELKGAKGDKGDEGKNFEVDGEVDLLSELPPASEHKGQIWLTNQYGHLHKSNGIEWLDWGQYTGIKGDKGDKGDDGVFDIDAITPQQLQDLHAKLVPLNNDQQWKYKTYVGVGQTARINIGDTNLMLRINRNSASVINYHFFPVDSAQPSLYYVKRLSNYDAVALESTYTSGWTPQAITNTGFALDASGYLPGREMTLIQVIDPADGAWYTIDFIGTGDGNMYVDVVRRATKQRTVITAT